MGLVKMDWKSREEELEQLSAAPVLCLTSAKGEGEEKLFFALWERVRSS